MFVWVMIDIQHAGHLRILLSSLCPFHCHHLPDTLQLDFGCSWLIECTARRLESGRKGEVKEFLPFSLTQQSSIFSMTSPPARQSLTVVQLGTDSLPVALVAWRFQILNSPYSASSLCLFTKDVRASCASLMSVTPLASAVPTCLELVP